MAEKKTVNEAAVLAVNNKILKSNVSLAIPYARAGEEQKIFVSVSGRNFSVPRGKVVTLPKYVAECVENVLRQEAKYEREVAQTYAND